MATQEHAKPTATPTKEHAKPPPMEWFAGYKEGLARMIGQSLTYVLEVRKSLYQIHGNAPAGALTPTQWLTALQRGIVQSSVSAGVVYGTYYHVYHRCSSWNWSPIEANAVATFLTSLIKIPISNAIRWVQLNPTQAIPLHHAARRIYTNAGFKGLYSGYGLSYIEDFIEMALRDALFAWLDAANTKTLQIKHHEIGFLGGAISGATVAFITTPFDTLRCHLTYRAGSTAQIATIFTPFHTTRQLVAEHGVALFYRGARTRAISTGLRMAFFYMFMKVL